MIFKDVTNFTSDPIVVEQRMRNAFITVTESIEVAVEIKGLDGVWRAFPETTFTGPTAKAVPLPAGIIRVKAVDGPVTITLDF